MDLKSVAKFVWENSLELEFGKQNNWDQNVFLKSWVENNFPGYWDNTEGLYWILSDIELNKLKSLNRPNNLPKNGCNFSKTAKKSLKLFDKDIVHKKSKIPVLYNGQRNKVFSRIRTHFTLKNNSTGALSIFSYSLQKYNWKIKIFHKGLIQNYNFISLEDKKKLKLLISEKQGRVALENMWRAIYGWPILCKM